MAIHITVYPEQRLRAANRNLLSTNIQWVFSGDTMTTNGVPRPEMTAAAKQIGCAGFLRYPGGFKADNFDWTQGEGALGSRGPNTDTFGNTQTTYFGTQECLNLCTALGLSPYFQTDAFGSNSRITTWMAAYPQVLDWEIGNEQYLKGGNPIWWMADTAQFLAIANTQVGAMLAANPNLRISVPLCTDLAGPIAGNHYPGWDNDMLAGLDRRVKRFALHLYMAHGSTPQTDENLWGCLMASYRTAEQFLADTKSELAAHSWGQYEFILTEYGNITQVRPNWPQTVAGTLLDHELLRIWANDATVSAAMLWSLAGNGPYGMIRQAATRRPAFYMMNSWSKLMRGSIIRHDIIGTSPLSNIQFSRLFAYTDTPSMNCIASHSDNVTRALMVNKKLTSSDSVVFQLPPGSPRAFARNPTVKCLQAAPGFTVFSEGDTESVFSFDHIPFALLDERTISFTAPQASLIFVEAETVMSIYIAEYGRFTGRPRPELFPSWVVKPNGRPLVFEPDFPQDALTNKFEAVVTGGGAGGSVAQTIDHAFGGIGAVALATNNASSSAARVQLVQPFTADNGVVAFEHRWLPGTNTADILEFGIGSHTNDTIDARLRYTVSTNEWRYQDPTQNDVYLPFVPPVIVARPAVNAAGDTWGWARLEVNFAKREFVRFQAAGPAGDLFDVAMLGIPMRNRADAAGLNAMTFYVKGIAGAASVETFYTTDWCISELYTY